MRQPEDAGVFRGKLLLERQTPGQDLAWGKGSRSGLFAGYFVRDHNMFYRLSNLPRLDKRHPGEDIPISKTGFFKAALGYEQLAGQSLSIIIYE